MQKNYSKKSLEQLQLLTKNPVENFIATKTRMF